MTKPPSLHVADFSGSYKAGVEVQGECRVLLENSTLEHNAAGNGAAFFASSAPCFMVSPPPLPRMLSSWPTLHIACPPDVVTLQPL